MKRRRVPLCCWLVESICLLPLLLSGCDELSAPLAPGLGKSAAGSTRGEDLQREFVTFFEGRIAAVDRLTEAHNQIVDEASASAHADTMAQLIKNEMVTDQAHSAMIQRMKDATARGDMPVEPTAEMRAVLDRFKARKDTFLAQFKRTPPQYMRFIAARLSAPDYQRVVGQPPPPSLQAQQHPPGMTHGNPIPHLPLPEPRVNPPGPTGPPVTAWPTPSTNPGFARPASSRPTSTPLADRAKVARIWHHNGQTADLMRAEIITSDDDDLLKEKLLWCPALRRPAISLYWGLGCELEGFPPSPHALPPFAPSRVTGAPRGRSRPARVSLPTQGFVRMDIEKTLGPMLKSLLTVLQQRVNDRQFGEWGDEPADPDASSSLLGISLLPANSQAQLIEAARNQGMDVLLVCHVKRDTKGAALTLRLIDVFTAGEIWESKPLHSSKVDLTSSDGGDAAVALLGDFLETVDNQLVLRKLPAIKATAVAKRAAKIVECPPEAALTVLAELRFYELSNLLDADAVRPLYQDMLGEQAGENFAGGDSEQRQVAISHLLLRE